MKAQSSWREQLRFIVGAIVLSFVGVTAFTHWRLAAIDRASLDIADNAAPSIERLATARAEMRRSQMLLRNYLDQKARGDSPDPTALDESGRAMNVAMNDYVHLPVFPGEHELWDAILRARDQLNIAIARCRSEADHDVRSAQGLADTDVARAAEVLATAITRDVEFNAGHSHDLALEIRRLRAQSMHTALVLDAICALIAIAGTIAVHRAIRAHEELARRHQRLLEEQASELEQFAGRIAHDILSPLGAVGFALHLAAETDALEQRAQYVARGTSALERVKRLVDGLLAFARAGAKSDPSNSSDVGAILADLSSDLRSAAMDAGAELEIQTDVTSAVACNAGVLTSLVSNLARNAIKYIGDGPVRRIQIRAFERGEFVRIEVRDTGPGLPPGLEEHVFEPYVRGPRATQAGIGLGLATVKRLALGHHGKVGVDSVPGEGCTFWFELPSAKQGKTT